MAINLIIDTDNGDRDDAKAFAYLHYALDHGYNVNLLACMADKRDPTNACRVSAYNTHFGRSGVRVGKNKTGTTSTDGFESAYLFPRRILRVGDAEEVVALYRELLAAAPDNSVRIVTIGRLNNLNDLLLSSGDGFDARNGHDLVAAKVEKVYCMGGKYPTGTGEANFSNAPSDTAYVLANWPTEIRFVGYEVGSTLLVPYASFSAIPDDSPIKDKVLGTGFDGEWDDSTLMAALEPDSDGWFTWVRGTNSYNAGTNTQTWTNDSNGKHYYAVKAKTDQQYVDFLTPRTTYYRAQTYTGATTDRITFDEGSGTTVSSAHGLVGTLTGTATLTAGPFLRCQKSPAGYAAFSTNDLFRFFPRRSRTIEFGVRSRTFSATEEIYFGGDRDAGGWWRLGITAAGSWLVTFNGGTDITGGSIANNTVYHGAVVFDGVAGTATLYINGSQVGSTYTTTGEVIAATQGSWDFGLGAGSSDSTRVANVDIDYFAVYEGAATSSQVQSLASDYAFGVTPDSSSSSHSSASSASSDSSSSSSSKSSQSSESSSSDSSLSSQSSASSLSSDSSSSDSSASSESSSSEGYSSLSSLSSLSSESSSSSNDLQQPLLDPIAVHNSYPVVLVNGEDRGRIVKVDQVTYRYSEVKNYTGPVTITLDSPYAHSEIRYTLNGKNPNPSSRQYTGPLVFRQNASGSDNTVIKARIYDKTNSNKKSQIIRLEFRVVKS